MNRRTGLRLIASVGATALAAGAGVLTIGAAADPFDRRDGGFPYDAFDSLPTVDLTLGGGRLHVGFAPGPFAVPMPHVFDWIRRAAQSVATYYGHFPVASARVLIVPVGGRGVRGGTTWGYRGAAIRMLVGADSEVADLDRDWMMTHEFVHTALPQMDRTHDWLSEGLAVYVEPIARVQAGDLTAASIWADMVRDMGKGLPRPLDEGLDATPTWGRTYWGGALFCLRADIAIRAATKNRLGLQDAMRGVQAAGGSHEVEWPIRKILGIADRTVGLDVLTAMYARERATPITPDLPDLWRKLGIESTADGLRFHDDAPLASARLAITMRPAAG